MDLQNILLNTQNLWHTGLYTGTPKAPRRFLSVRITCYDINMLPGNCQLMGYNDSFVAFT